jgi:hypothetical protein
MNEGPQSDPSGDCYLVRNNVGMNGWTIARIPFRVGVIVILGLQILASCWRAQMYAGQCCPGDWLNPSKLLQSNLPGSPGTMAFTLEYGPSRPFDLAQLLRKPTHDASIIWTVK